MIDLHTHSVISDGSDAPEISEFQETLGYLRSVLEALGTPVDSQMLVFAKNSVHARLISPKWQTLAMRAPH